MKLYLDFIPTATYNHHTTEKAASFIFEIDFFLAIGPRINRNRAGLKGKKTKCESPSHLGDFKKAKARMGRAADGKDGKNRTDSR